ncbi:hypothetical protein GCM10009555_069580 [Acrocarpospora macrocephala]|uniref:Uncharacterized protein n=1 Tax=Acrocarpospora macrocephala TaxID=150177 RepID=A0A5M3WZ14_9ACTN|nr:hypothetical protein [Acrocarpospora macrocephala]GES13129.1 hypothetical protein Amac_067260 [Acrocarpospora macrocephala]
MTITITLPRLPATADLGRALRTLWPWATIALPALAEIAGASVLVRVMLEVAMRMAERAMGL